MAERSTESSHGKKVIIGIDGSENSLNAVEWYAHHAYKPDDFIILVYCVELNELLSSSELYESQDSADVDAIKSELDIEINKIQAKLEEFGAFLKKLKMKGVVKSTQASKPGEGILKVAREENATLVVTGTRGLGKLRRTILGSVSDYLVHHSDVPVLVCRPKEKEKKEKDKK